MMKLPWFRIVILGCFVLPLGACGPAGVPDLTDETQSPPAAPLPASATQTVPEKDEAQMTQPAPSSSMDSLIGKAKEDLSKRLSIAVPEISLVEAKEVVWPDASLGCPQPGVAFAQVLTPGYLVRFEVNDESYEYHTNMLDGVILCDSVYEVDSPSKNTDENVQDGWPNQTKDRDVIFPTPRK